MTKDLKKLNKELAVALVEFRKHATKIESKTKKKGFIENFFRPALNDIPKK